MIIGIAIPGDGKTEKKEQEKNTKHQDLLVELECLWEKKVTIVSVVNGALETVPRNLRKHLGILGIEHQFSFRRQHCLE